VSAPAPLDRLLSLIGDFDREITAATREIDARAKADERVSVLCQIRAARRSRRLRPARRR
jgi:hypothetical protein